MSIPGKLSFNLGNVLGDGLNLLGFEPKTTGLKVRGSAN